MTLQELQTEVDAWIKQYGVRYFSELTNMACLTEEVGEMARIMSRTYGDQSFKEGEKHDLGDEIADVLWVLTCIANQTGVNLEEAIRKNIAKKPIVIKRDTLKTRNLKTQIKNERIRKRTLLLPPRARGRTPLRLRTQS